MPRLIDPGVADAFDLPDLIDGLECDPFDPRDEDSFAAAGPLLARLGRNPDFLANLAIDELKDRRAVQSPGAGYNSQVFLLRPPNGRYAIRANFWPAANDAVTRASGTSTFVYDFAHDHNFSFLTYGYLGPGYWSDYYERDADTVLGLPGEDAGLRFIERSRLEQGKLMLYRARTDVHCQLPPNSFSVSLNILGYAPGQGWIDQYGFDLQRGTVGNVLNATAAEALLDIAARMDNGRDLAASFARTHPCSRMRMTAIDAMLAVDQHEGLSLLERAADDGDRHVAAHARLRLDRVGSIMETIAS